MAEEDKARCPASPGPVRNDECIAVGLWSPGVFDKEKGALTVEALKLDHFTMPKGGHVDKCGDSTGLSSGRVGRDVSRRELFDTLRAICDGKPRTIEGSAIADVGAIRSIVTGDGGRAFEVLDDGKDSFTTHAVIRGMTGLTRGALRDPRDKLLQMLNGRVERSTFDEFVQKVGESANSDAVVQGETVAPAQLSNDRRL